MKKESNDLLSDNYWIVIVASMAQSPTERLQTAFTTRPSMTWLNAEGNPGAPHQQVQFIAAADAPVATALFAGARRSWAQVSADLAANRVPASFALRQTIRAEKAATAETFDSPNVVGIIPGTDPSVANEYIVLMAHLDHVGTINPNGQGQRPPTGGNTDTIYNGAMDNATGIATLIEVARKFNDPANRPRRPVGRTRRDSARRIDRHLRDRQRLQDRRGARRQGTETHPHRPIAR